MRPLVCLLFLAAACARPVESAEAFQADPGRAERTVRDCEAGRRHGAVCDNARLGAARAARAPRLEQYRRGF